MKLLEENVRENFALGKDFMNQERKCTINVNKNTG